MRHINKQETTVWHICNLIKVY